MPLHVSRSLIRIRWESITNWCDGVDMSEAKLRLLRIMLLCSSSDEFPAAGSLVAGNILGGGSAMAGADLLYALDADELAA